jgi:hypothetical protein
MGKGIKPRMRGPQGPVTLAFLISSWRPVESEVEVDP